MEHLDLICYIVIILDVLGEISSIPGILFTCDWCRIK